MHRLLSNWAIQKLEPLRSGYVSETGTPTRTRHVTFYTSARFFRKQPVNLTPQASTFLPLPQETISSRTDAGSFLEWLFKRAGLDVYEYNAHTLLRRTSACLRTLHAGSYREARQLLERSPSLIAPAISALVIGVTSFFRDEAVFETLRDRILPDLSVTRSRLRVWSIGCSDGAELYSIAILLAEKGILHRAEILGTDCRVEAIAKARRGRYDPSAVRSIPQELQDRYLKCQNGQCQIDEALRQAVQWRTANVLSQIEPGQWDLILCRNMAMYLNAASSSRLWRRLQPVLCSGGALVLGKAERPVGVRQLIPVAPCIYRHE